MFSIIRLNIKDMFKSRIYLMQLFMAIVIFSFITIAMLNNNKGQTNDILTFIIQYMLVLSNISMFFMVFSMCINNLCVVEKCNRLEYYLANGVTLNKLLNAYCICTFLLSLVSVVIFNFIIYIYNLIFNNSIKIYNLNFIVMLLATLFFFYSISLLINSIALFVKNTNMIYTFVFILSFIFLFGGSFSLQNILKINIDISLDTIIIAILLVVSSILIAIGLIFKKKLNNEKIILSIKE